MKEKENLLQIKGVNKLYKLENKTTFQALTDINLSFGRGELVSIVGESGSGKSTLMNLIGGLDSDFDGDIVVDGQSLKNLKEKDLDKYRKNKVGFVFQSFNLIPHLSILDNVTIALTLSNEKESVKVEKATKLLTRLGLEKQLKKRPTQLSGGQKQRVAIARALINEPEIILADEPTGALDSGTTLQILEILKEIANEGKLVIMVTHSEKVASVSSRIVEISDGKVVRDEQNKKPKQIEKKELKSNADHQTKNDAPAEKNQATKQNLSLWSALRLSLHNMWASKTKNLLMAFGVSISILSMILMLSFGSGLTGYINHLASSYASAEVVTITKRNQLTGPAAEQGAFVADLLAPPSFADNAEIDTLVDDINGYLDGKSDFRVDKTDVDPENSNISYGFQIGASALSLLGVFSSFGLPNLPKISATWTLKADRDNPESEDITKDIFYLYTTPAYYSEKNMLSKGDKTHFAGENEVMFSTAFAEALELDLEDWQPTPITLNIKIDDIEISEEVTVSAIVDTTQFFATEMIMYVDYDFFESIVNTAAINKSSDFRLHPTTIYIHTDGQKTTDLITAYRETRSDEFQGELEGQVAGLFNEMLSTFSIALAIIAGISLVVAAIMILVVLYMSVTERTREIGVLKSIGARRKDIKRIFSAESFLIGVLSGIVGIILSLLVGGAIMFAMQLAIGTSILSFKWWYFVGALAISIVISVLSGLYPAAKAAKLDPVESLRHE